jgi:hypothetical protein
MAPTGSSVRNVRIMGRSDNDSTSRKVLRNVSNSGSCLNENSIGTLSIESINSKNSLDSYKISTNMRDRGAIQPRSRKTLSRSQSITIEKKPQSRLGKRIAEIKRAKSLEGSPSQALLIVKSEDQMIKSEKQIDDKFGMISMHIQPDAESSSPPNSEPQTDGFVQGKLDMIRIPSKDLDELRRKATRMEVDREQTMLLVNQLRNEIALALEKGDDMTQVSSSDTIPDAIFALQSQVRELIRIFAATKERESVLGVKFKTSEGQSDVDKQDLRKNYHKVMTENEHLKIEVALSEQALQAKEVKIARERDIWEFDLAEMKGRMVEQEDTIAKQHNEILLFPRKEEYYREKMNHHYHLKEIELRHSNNDRRRLVTKLQKLAFWENKARELGHELTRLRFHSELERKSSKVRPKDDKRAPSAGVPDEEGAAGGNSSPGLDSVRADDKDVLIQYLEEELVKKSARINELFGLMSKARSRPLVHADVEEANDDKELLELEDDEDDQSLLDFEELANRTEGLSDFDRKTMEEMSKRAFISRVGDEVSLVSLFSFFFLN